MEKEKGKSIRGIGRVRAVRVSKYQTRMEKVGGQGWQAMRGRQA